MHQQISDWVRQLWHKYPALFHGTRVLECGSRIGGGGSIGNLFADCEYTGLDAQPGNGVDVVGLAHEYQPGRSFDVVVSCQMLEHDPYWRESVANMVDILEPGGALILSWAGPGYPVHDRHDSPTPGYYGNLALEDVLGAMDNGHGQRFQGIEAQGDGLGCICLLARGKEAGSD